MNTSKNIAMLETVARALQELKDDVVFVGGATTSLYIDDKHSPLVTPSDDVDCIVEIANLSAYSVLERKLLKKGFTNPIKENQPICRKVLASVTVDIMPLDPSILGFSNRWYEDGFASRQSIQIAPGLHIFILPVHFFLGTKLEALKNRGGNDYRMSQDLEDIASVLDGCSRVEMDFENAPVALKKYIQTEFKRLLKDESLLTEAMEGFLRPSPESNVRAKAVVSRINRLVKSI